MNMNVPAWHIVTWPTVQITVSKWQQLTGFQFVGLSSRHDDDGRLLGNTLWASEDDFGPVGLAWEWCESNANVFVMTDPMSVMSNVALTDVDNGDEADNLQRILHLNNVIYQLPWQKQLLQVVKSGSGQSVSALAPA